MTIPGLAADSLLDLFTASGLDAGEFRVKAQAPLSLSVQPVSDGLLLTLSPAIEVTKEGLLGRLAKGRIRRIKLTDRAATVYVELPIVGTIERRIEITR